MANALLQEKGLFGEYILVPLHASASRLVKVLDGLRHLQNFAGAIVSMPHKSAVVPLLDELSPEARLVGAVNVIRREPDGGLVGATFDGEGFVAGLRSAGHDVCGKTCLLVGAGGAAAAIAVALAKHGCKSLTLSNRTEAKAASLASRVREACPHVQVQVGVNPGGGYDFAINATSLGMKPDDELPLSHEVIKTSTVIAECVIAPEMTPLLEAAQQVGRVIHTGVPMLAAQMNLMLEFMGVEQRF
jgi:shikimate dehydrogenase